MAVKSVGRILVFITLAMLASPIGKAAELNVVHSASQTQLLRSQAFFERNDGQTDKRVSFLSHGLGYRVLFTNDGAWIVLAEHTHPGQRSVPTKTDVIRVTLTGADPHVEVTGADALSGKSNYFSGAESKFWHTGIPHFAAVIYRHIYSGIDLKFYVRDGHLEFDFLVSPHANANAIRLKFEGAEPSVTGVGDVCINVRRKCSLLLKKALIYQPAVEDKQIRGSYAARGGELSFSLGKIDHNSPLVIDPALMFSTYLDSSCSDVANCSSGITDLAVDRTGVYLTGGSKVPSFPSSGPGEPVEFEYSFVAKFDPTGSNLLYTNFLNDSQAQSIAIDSSGAAYIAGFARFPPVFGQTLFPTTAGAFSPVPTTCSPSTCLGTVPFAAKFSPDGATLLYSTLLQFFTSNGQPNPSAEEVRVAKVAVDSSGALYLTGATEVDTSGLPLMPLPVTVGAYQTTRPPGATRSLFVMKLNPSGSGLNYSTYLGGAQIENSLTANGIAVDSDFSAYVTGNSLAGYPTTPGSYQPQNTTGGMDAVLTKLSPDGSSLVYSTYFGGPANLQALGLAVDSQHQAAMVGSGINTSVAPNASCPNPFTIPFIAKLNATASSVVYSNSFCAQNGQFTAIAVDSSDAAYVLGFTDTPAAFPILNPIKGYYISGATAPPPQVVAKFDTSGALVWSTFFGTAGGIGGFGIAVDPTGSAFIFGENGIDVPITPNAFEVNPVPNGFSYLAKIAPSLGAPVPIVSATSIGFGNQPVGTMSAAADASVGNFGDSPMSPAVSITGDFSQMNTCASTVPAGQKCDVSVIFVPTSTGNRSGTLTVNFGGMIPAQNVALAGVGTVAVASPSPASLTFPLQTVGVASASQQVIVTDTGTAPLAITAIQVSGDFAQTNTCGGSIAPGSNCVVQVTFTPTTVGTRNGALALTDNAPDSPQQVPLVGTGTNVSIGIAPSTLTFQAQMLGTSSSPQTAVISNTGQGLLTILSVQTSSDFSQTNGCTAEIAPGNACSVQITFTPTAYGTRPGVLTITDNAYGTPHTISLSGTGMSLALAVASGSSNSATIQAGGTATYTLTIGGAAFAGTASVTCWGAPTGANCSAPTAVSVSASSPSTFGVSVTTTGRTLALVRPSRDLRMSGLWTFAAFGLFVIAWVVRSGPRMNSAVWLYPLLLLSLAAPIGCGSSGNNGPQLNPNATPAGTYTLTVTATSGTVSQSLPLTLTVQ